MRVNLWTVQYRTVLALHPLNLCRRIRECGSTIPGCGLLEAAEKGSVGCSMARWMVTYTEDISIGAALHFYTMLGECILSALVPVIHGY